MAGEKWPQYLEVLRPGGRYAVAGAIAGPLVELDVRTLYLKDLSLFGCTVLLPNVFKNMINRIEQGAISPVVARVCSGRNPRCSNHVYEQAACWQDCAQDLTQFYQT